MNQTLENSLYAVLFPPYVKDVVYVLNSACRECKYDTVYETFNWLHHKAIVQVENSMYSPTEKKMMLSMAQFLTWEELQTKYPLLSEEVTRRFGVTTIAIWRTYYVCN